MKESAPGRFNRASVVGLVLVVAAATGLSLAAAAGAGTRAAVPKGAITTTTVKPGPAVQASLPPLGSQLLFSNFGPSLNAYYCCTAWTVAESGNVVTGTYAANANGFTPSVSGQVSRIDIALSNYFGTNNATVELVQDNAGLPTGKIMGAWSVASQPPFGGCCTITTINVSPLIALGAGKHYWLLALPGPNVFNDTLDVWNWTYNFAQTGPIESYIGGVGWVNEGPNPSGAFDIVGCGKICKV